MPTLHRTLRQAIEAALDDGGRFAVSSAAASTVASAALVNATSNASANTFDGAWVYLASGAAGVVGQQRMVKPGTYVPSTGTLGIFPPWTSTPTGGEIMEVTRVFPSVAGANVAGVTMEDTSYQSIENRALSRLAIPDRVEFAIGTGWRYATTSYPWLDRPERFVRALEPGPTGLMPVDCTWRGVQLRLDGATPHLEIAAPFEHAGGTLVLEVIRPGNSLINVSGGGWAESSVGLVNDDDYCLPSFEDVFPEAMFCAYQALAARSPGRPYPKAAELMEFWLGEARKGRYHDRALDPGGQQQVEPAVR